VDPKSPGAAAYICPMHADVRQTSPGTCPTCGMPLVAETGRFPLLRHMFGSPLHVVAMLVLMALLMVASMMVMR